MKMLMPCFLFCLVISGAGVWERGLRDLWPCSSLSINTVGTRREIRDPTSASLAVSFASRVTLGKDKPMAKKNKEPHTEAFERLASLPNVHPHSIPSGSQADPIADDSDSVSSQNSSLEGQAPRKRKAKTHHTTPNKQLKVQTFEPGDIIHPRSTAWVPPQELVDYVKVHIKQEYDKEVKRTNDHLPSALRYVIHVRGNLQLCSSSGTASSGLADKVVWAINAGGEAHVDVHGIHYKKDPLEGRVGRASDYGLKLPILRSNPEDQVLYQTERYNEETFGYEVPIKEEGDYVVVVKFAEVYFAQSQQKVFDVRLNGHVVVKDLDIFDRVGHSTAHDEIIPVSVKKGKLSVQGEVSTFTGKLHIEFVKGYYDNPKVCAILIMKGMPDEVPKLLPHPGLEKKEEEEEEEEYEDGSSSKKQVNRNRVQSGPRTPNPYASDNSSLMFPILVAFGVFIPTLFCLCRL
ncbi:hypothetical protein NDU88_006500 [Pleurodeles waltl]|uniref:Malectin domain-containing protein n=1 Tax=Pleurodeles waltl TaxID=8319 RepID=A0AAV7LR10_PLEWA|nr:hypothetical protein NDU88_006500 [Pleurodeles waltl]